MNRTTTNRTNDSHTKTGKLMGIFWAIFQCSSLVGGATSFMYYNKEPEEKRISESNELVMR